MKWDIYKKLTDKEKEEWHFKYDHIEAPHIGLWSLIMLYGVFTLFLCIALLVAKADLAISNSAFFYLELGAKAGYIMILAYVIDMLINWAFVVTKWIKEYRWLKSIEVRKR